jgi:DNA-binding HxlR family transcriptional regulator
MVRDVAARAVGKRIGDAHIDDFQGDLDIPRSVLSNRVAGLVESGLMERREYREDGQRDKRK